MDYEIVSRICYVVVECDDEGNGEMVDAFLSEIGAEEYIESCRDKSEDWMEE